MPIASTVFFAMRLFHADIEMSARKTHHASHGSEPDIIVRRLPKH
jgi:hypothetical protein